MPDFLWGAPGSPYTLLTTELNSLQTGWGTALGPEIDNSTNKWQVCRLELLIASNSLAFTAASRARVFLLPRQNDGSYPHYVSGATPRLAEANYFAGGISIHPATVSAQVIRESAQDVWLPQGRFRAVLFWTGPTLPASGNTLLAVPTPLAS
ncbi:hypothetical protein UFOVP326_19 [uncultured Caudovirales phage]|uniref:Uncharacterized protein n=1 Tax=uncultured Caudovirales phage TaxID=2100421 RepID=A0A6J5LWH8_9CAUD|nr:hypothetical protein UFOVP326_19 [uncultured Caudovirales phage]